MNRFQLGHDEDVNVIGRYAILTVQSHSFADIFVKLIDGFALREDVFPNSAGTPKIAIAIHFDLNQHKSILYRLRSISYLCFYFTAAPPGGTREKCVSIRTEEVIAKTRNPRRTPRSKNVPAGPWG